MPSDANQIQDADATLFIAFELSLSSWKLAFGTDPRSKPRFRSVGARDLQLLRSQIGEARRAFGLQERAPVVSCYEAGRDGFWLHRFLTDEGIQNHVVDSASIEVSRRGRRAKTDRLDARKLLTMLIRFHAGEPGVWSTAHVPSVEDEDARNLHRELRAAKQERNRHTNRIKGLLMSQGIQVERVPKDVPRWLDTVRLWNEESFPAGLRARIEHEAERRALAEQQVKKLEAEQSRTIRSSAAPRVEKVRRLMMLRGIGARSAWLFAMEFFGWREFRNRREIGALAGLVPVPHRSGNDDRTRGISKAGNRLVRAMAVDLAWMWLRLQPESQLSLWYQERFAKGGPRLRKIGIVALARKLLIALWTYLEFGVIPEGATMKA